MDQRDKDIIEEDWSSFINQRQDDNEQNGFQLTGFSQHNVVVIQLSTHSNKNANTVVSINASANHDNNADSESSHGSYPMTNMTMTIHCVESLTPLDMINLSNGHHDSTGHRIWMGALFFIECFVCPLELGLPTNSNYHNDEKEKMVQLLSEWRIKLFHKKDVLELGAGTGASGISIMIAGAYANSYHGESEKEGRRSANTIIAQPNCMIFTDSDTDVIKLCKENIIRNVTPIYQEHNLNADVHVKEENRVHKLPLVKQTKYSVNRLEWGNDENIFTQTTNNSDDKDIANDEGTSIIIKRHSQDSVIATDVIYDTMSVRPLFQTAASVIKLGGYFVLSHIPRACIECKTETDCSPSSSFSIRDQIEALILNEAENFGFRNVDWKKGNDYCIRPNDLLKVRKNMVTSDVLDFHEMQSVGAGIFIFQCITQMP